MKGTIAMRLMHRIIPGVVLLTVGLAWSLAAYAQFAIDWYTIDGGGGTSTSGVYAVSGTIGQPDAGPAMTGGAYSVEPEASGIWSQCRPRELYSC